MITIHHLDHSRSTRIIWLLEELGVPYEIKNYKRLPSYAAPEELTKIHPLGKAPVMTDGNKVIAESGAIIEYILDTYGEGKFRPSKGTQAYLDNLYWFHATEGSLMPLLITRLYMVRLGMAPVPAWLRPFGKALGGGFLKNRITPQIETFLDLIESHLAKNKWFAGDEVTSSDFMMSYALESIVGRHIEGDRPHIKNYVEQLHTLPAYKRAVEKGGEVAL